MVLRDLEISVQRLFPSDISSNGRGVEGNGVLVTVMLKMGVVKLILERVLTKGHGLTTYKW